MHWIVSTPIPSIHMLVLTFSTLACDLTYK